MRRRISCGAQKLGPENILLGLGPDVKERPWEDRGG